MKRFGVRDSIRQSALNRSAILQHRKYVQNARDSIALIAVSIRFVLVELCRWNWIMHIHARYGPRLPCLEFDVGAFGARCTRGHSSSRRFSALRNSSKYQCELCPAIVRT